MSVSNPDLIHSSFWGGDMEALVLQGGARGLFDKRVTLLTAGETGFGHFKDQAPNGTIVGVLPREEVGGTASEAGASEAVGGQEELGVLFAEGSELVPCVNQGLAALRDDGVLEALEEEWLSQSGDIPTLSP